MEEEERNKLNTLPFHINFRNCKVHIKTGNIEQRTPDDFITEYIDFDYIPEPDMEITKYIKKMLKRICNNDKEELELILSFLGYGITSETKEQKLLNIWGPLASNGKSTLIKIMNMVFSIYCPFHREWAMYLHLRSGIWSKYPWGRLEGSRTPRWTVDDPTRKCIHFRRCSESETRRSINFHLSSMFAFPGAFFEVSLLWNSISILLEYSRGRLSRPHWACPVFLII